MCLLSCRSRGTTVESLELIRLNQPPVIPYLCDVVAWHAMRIASTARIDMMMLDN